MNEDTPVVVEKSQHSPRVCEGHNEAGLVLPPPQVVQAEPETSGLETAEGRIALPEVG